MRAAALLLLALALPLASAQAPFGFEDSSFDAMPPAANAYADLRAGGLEVVDGERLRATLELAALPEPHPGLAYGFLFSDGARDWYLALVMAPAPTYFYGAWAGDRPDTVDEGTGSYVPGAPGTVVAEMPLDALGNATQLSKPRGITADGKLMMLPIGSGPLLVFDEAAGEGTLALPAREAQPQAEPARGTDDDARGEATPAAAVAPAEDPPTAEERATVPLPLAAALAALALARARRRSR